MRAVALLFFTLAAYGQPAFEVASIKVSNNAQHGVEGGCHGVDSNPTVVPLGRCVITEARLSHMIGIAWKISMTNLDTGPDWIQRGDERFDLEAKAEDPRKATEEQLLKMLQALLIERFHLKYHRADVEKSGYALVIAKGGPKLKESTAERRTFKGPKPVPGRPASVALEKTSTSMLADMLTAFGPGPTVDKTGLTGEYDFQLSWDDKAGPTLFSVLQDQLGLKLVAQKVTISRFIVDSAERPTPN